MVSEDFGRCFVLTDFSEMAEDERGTTRKAQLALGKAVAVMIEEGIADGSVRRCKPVVTSRLLYAAFNGIARLPAGPDRSEEHTSELQSLMRTSYAVFCLKKKQQT